MDRSTDDTTAWGGDGRHRNASADVRVAVAEPPGRPGASSTHWADGDSLYRRPERPFRRPPAENSFPDPAAGGTDTTRQRRRPGPREMPPADLAAAEQAATRHWTAVDESTRRPRTSDRPEVTTGDGPRRKGLLGFLGGKAGGDAGPPIDPARQAAARRDFDRAERRTGGRANRPLPPVAPGPMAATTAATERVSAARRKAAAAESAFFGDEPGPVASIFGDEPGPVASIFGDPPAGGDAGIGNLIIGGGREIRPHRAVRKEVPAPAAARPGAPRPPAPRGRQFAQVCLLVVGLLGIGGGALYAFADPGSGGLTSVLRSDASRAGGRTVTAPLAGREAATFDVQGVTELVTIRAEDLGNDLYKIAAAEDSGVLPAPVVAEDTVRLGLTPDGGASGGPVEVVLNSKVRWALRLTGGVLESRVDFTGGRLSGVELLAGARRVELSLGEPENTVGVTVTGSVDELVLRAPTANPARLKLASGAKTVAAGERTLRDVEPGATFTPKGWDTEDRYDVTVASRATLVSVETR